MERMKIGISIGDFNGIGLEVVLKTLEEKNVLDICTPVIFGSTKVVSYHKNITGGNLLFHSIRPNESIASGKVNIVNCWNENVTITLGKPTDQSGKYASISLEAAAEELKNGTIDALVTAPISKSAMQMAGFGFPGHTEFLTSKIGSGESLMLMISDYLRVGLVTNHVPIKDVANTITHDLIANKLQLLNDSLRIDFGIERPTIAVLALNPHAGDDGLIGTEDDKIVRPVVIENKKKGMVVVGPFPADAFFGTGMYKKFDGVLAMYHDQGLIPFKALSFGDGVNFTAGISAVRTSPDHGTAYDIAGKNEADHSSFRRALYAAIDIARNRKTYAEMYENTLIRRAQDLEEEPSKGEVIETDEVY